MASEETSPALVSTPAAADGPVTRLRQRWNLAYYGLIAFNLLTAFLALALTQKTEKSFDASLEQSYEWSKRLHRFEEVRRLAKYVHSPPQQLLATGDVVSQARRQREAMEGFNAALREARAGLALVSAEVAAPLLRDLAMLESGVEALRGESKQLFAEFARGEPRQAAERMAAIDARYDEVLEAHARVMAHVREIQFKLLLEDDRTGNVVRRYETGISFLIVLMMVAAVAYGRRASRESALAEAQREQTLGALRQARAELESRVHERTRELARTIEELEKEVAERTRTEEQLRESEQRFQLVARATNDAIYDWSTATNDVWQSEAIQTLFGYPPHDTRVQGDWWLEKVHPEDRERVLKGVEQFLAGTETYYASEYRFQRADGSFADVLDRGYLIRDPEGRPVRQIGSMMDITDRIRAQEASFRLAAIVESTHDAIVGKSLEGIITSWNAGAKRLYGYDPQEVLGRSAMILQAPGHEDEETGILERVRSGERVENFETVRLRKDGSLIALSLTVSPIRDSDGKIVGVSTIARDITARKRAQEELRVAKEAAETASRAKSQFLANMSHEIRTPMNGIIGMTELVLDTELNAGHRESLGIVLSSAESLLDIINDILDFSKIEAGKLTIDSHPFLLRESLGDTLRVLAARAEQKGLELVFRVAPDVPEQVVGDSGRLRQVLLNLVGNAIKFTSQGEIVVEVDAARGGPEESILRFSVTDSGIGIPPEKQRLIFEPFTQADSSTTREFGGTGLGLSISARLIDLMGGALAVESEIGLGSAFRFTLPMALGTDPAAPQEHVAAPERLAGLRVLVVDDNATNRRILDETLKGWGMRSVTVEGVAPALEALARAWNDQELFQLLLIDAHMPHADGFELARHLQQDPRFAGAVVMMLSSGPSGGDAARCQEMGISAYLVKPVKQSELREAVLRVVSATSRVEPLSSDNGTQTGRRFARIERDNAPAEKDGAPAWEERPVRRTTARPLRILVAEDNTVNQLLAVRVLKRQGHVPTVVSNGRQALEAVQAGEYDLVLMDLSMPEMGGLEATAAIREHERPEGGHLPIVAMTAHAMQGDRERCLKAGMDDYLSKPLRAQDLIEMVERFAGVDRTASEESRGAPAADAETKLDRDALLARVDGDTALLQELIGLFLETSPRHLTAIRQSVERGDAEALERTAHSLRSSASVLGTNGVFEAARELEAIGRSRHLLPASAAYARLEERVSRFTKRLEELLAEVPA